MKITKRSDHSERTDNIAEAHESQSSESDVAGAGSELDNNSQSSCQPEENLASIKQSTQEGEFVRKSLQATPTLQKFFNKYFFTFLKIQQRLFFKKL